MTAGRNVNTTSINWGTPSKYVDLVKRFYGGEIDLDPCSNHESIVGAKVEFVYPQKDGLEELWNYNNIYVNPPYGRCKETKTSIKDWFKRCYESNSIYNSEVIALVPVATNTSHWKEYVFSKAKAICFLYDTRLKFRISGNENNKGCPMACCFIYWGEDFEKFKMLFKEHGYIVKIE